MYRLPIHCQILVYKVLLVESERVLKPARNPPATSILDLIPLLRFFRRVGHELFKLGHHGSQDKRKRSTDYVESNVPLEIILVLSKCVLCKSLI